MEKDVHNILLYFNPIIVTYKPSFQSPNKEEFFHFNPIIVTYKPDNLY